MEPTHRWGGWRAVAGAALVLLVAAGVFASSCTGAPAPQASGGAAPTAGRGPSAADVAALSGPATGAGPAGAAGASSTTSTTSTSSPTAGSGAAIGPDEGPGGGDPSRPGASLPPMAAEDCAALEQVVIPAASIITAEDFVPSGGRSGAAEPADRSAAVARVAAIVPSRQRPAWDAVAASAATAHAAGRAATEQEVAAFRSARNAVEVWARSVCPGAPPSWRCDHFGSAGAGPDVAPTRSQAATPEGALRRNSNAGASRELERADGAVLYGWVDEAGFVTRTVQVERVDGGWATARVHVCHRDA